MIEIHRSDAAKMLRRVRERAHMTLKDAASAMRFSSSLIARKERGEARIERIDIRNAIEVYNLAPWEAYELWISAGFTPEKTVTPISVQDVSALATDLLTNIKYPANLADAAGYIRAWNGPYEAICHVGAVIENQRSIGTNSTSQVHLIDLLFSAQVKRCLADEWEAFADQSIERFYRQTIQIANEPFFPYLIKRLKEQYGDEFIRQWNRAQTYTPPEESVGHYQHHIAICHPPEIGDIEYIIMQSTFLYSPSLELNVHMPLGKESHSRYDLLHSTFEDLSIHIL